MRVGVIGLGIMGAPMTRNLLRAGHEVVVHGRTPARVEPLAALGAGAAATPAALAATTDAVLTCLPDGPDVERVVTGPDGALAGAARGALVIDTSTIAPDTARSLARVGVALPTTAIVHQLLASVEARGGGALGTQAIAQALEALAGPGTRS
jgi:3-hydroxyisobutyrate dehydrogenase-like beta-hydroxyacid dehydrogenase